MQTNHNHHAAPGAAVRASSTLSRAETLADVVFDLWHLTGGSQSAWTLSRILAGVASLIDGEQISREARDRMLVAIGEAQANFVDAMFDPENLGPVVYDGLRALAAIAVWLEQDHLARGTRDPAEIEALLARMRLCRLEMDALVRRADRAQQPRRSTDTCPAAR